MIKWSKVIFVLTKSAWKIEEALFNDKYLFNADMWPDKVSLSHINNKKWNYNICVNYLHWSKLAEEGFSRGHIKNGCQKEKATLPCLKIPSQQMYKNKCTFSRDLATGEKYYFWMLTVWYRLCSRFPVTILLSDRAVNVFLYVILIGHKIGRVIREV